MGAFATFYQLGHDPLMVKLCQLVMTDEAFHHKFGKIWADRTVPHLSQDERNKIEDWAWEVFQVLLFNLASPDQKSWIYKELGLDPDWVQQAFVEALTDAEIRKELQETTNIFRVLIKTLLNAGIITERTRPVYAMWVDMDELKGEGERIAGEDIADEALIELRDINRGRKKIGRAGKSL